MTALIATAAVPLAAHLGLASPAEAQGPDAQTALSEPLADWAAVEASVAAEIAKRWRVEPEQLALDWGPRESVELSSDAQPTLVGGGTNGHWVVRLEGTRGTVGVRVRAGVTTSTPVAAHQLRRGELLGSEDVEYEVRTVWGSPTLETPSPSGTSILAADPGPVGWVTQRLVRAGEALASPAVLPPAVVESGETVEVTWSNGPIRMTLLGRAIGTARAGQTVSVRLETGKRVRGVADQDGIVRVWNARP